MTNNHFYVITGKAILTLMLSLALVSVCSADDSNSLDSDILQTAKIEMPSGTFMFKIFRLPYNEHLLGMQIIAHAKKGSDQVKIQDEADALKQFLAGASNKGIEIINLLHIHIPMILEQEVQERLSNAAAVSKAWKHYSRGWPNKPVGDLLLASNAFKEIDEVLRIYGLWIARVGVEEVLTRKQRVEGRHPSTMNLPFTATAWLLLKQESER